jgi:hypothetical protein
VIAKRNGVAARRGLKEAWSKDALTMRQKSAQTSYNYLILHRLEDEKPFRSGAYASNESASSFTILFNSEFPSALLG